ncbi:DUF3413 domain-containing protein [Zobellella aerophila]|uniref:DUF3413 domain-containing protein n=1 Tax=Zobellella aerophila TaxID=870480 RepID=A0ABP6UZU0_9GAMM
MVETGNLYRDNVSRLIGWGHWFVSFNILLAIMVASRYLIGSDWPDTPLGVAYLLVSWVGHFAFLSFFTYLLTLFPLTFLLPRLRAVQFLGATIATAALTLLLIDTQVFSLFKFHLNPTVWRLLLDPSQSEQASGWGWLFIWLPLLFLLELWLANWLWRWSQRRRRSMAMPIALPLVVCFFLTHTVHIWADATLYSPITAQKANFPLSYPMTAKGFLIKRGWLDPDDYQKTSSQQGSEGRFQVIYPLRQLTVQAPGKPSNILLVVADGLRFDMLDAIVMPNLSRYADRHLRFNNHLSAANHPEAGLFSLFYSLPAHYRTGVEADAISPVFIDELQRQDYLMGLFVSNGLDKPLYEHAIFSTLRNQPFRPAVGGAEGDRQAQAALIEWLKGQDGQRPWFSYLYLDALNALDVPMGVTGPFQPSLERLNPAQAYQDKQREALFNRYRNAAFYTDQLLGQLFETLREQGMEHDTLVVITASHGMEFNENRNNTWGYGSSYSPYQLHVPLVLAWPGRGLQSFEHNTSQLDLIPTLMKEALGVESPFRVYANGQSLFEAQANRWRLAADNEEYVIYQQDQVTLFNQQGDFQLLSLPDYRAKPDANPELSLLLQVMNELNRFQRQH